MQIADDGDAANFVDSSGRVDRGIKPELEHFVNCIKDGVKPLNDGESARLAVAVCLAAQESIKREESVYLSELLG
jgi:predicted dehydrogenase